MAAAQPKVTNPFETSFDDPRPKDNKDEWEDWDVDSDNSPSTPHPDGLLIDLSDNISEDKTRKAYNKPASTRMTQHRSVQISRVKSRARQKAQNAKAGIKVVTDMTQFRQPGTVAQQRSAGAINKKKFADAAALQALEGKPSSPSIGSFAWLKRRPGNARSKKSYMSTTEDHSPSLSPDSRPIVIGISVPSDDVGSHQVSPQTAVVETPMDMRSFSHRAGSNKAPTPQQQRSVWSPDTEASESPYSGTRAASSIYSQYTTFTGSKIASDAPPVPSLPATLKFKQTLGQQDQEDEDAGTPCTPFEEDDSPVATRKPEKLKAVTVSPESASSRAHGWWDHVTTPFTPQPNNNPFKTQPQQTGTSSSSSPQEWWSGRDEKERSSRTSHLTIITPANQREKGGSTLDAITLAPVNEPRGESHSEKSRVLLEENRSNDAPPPYEPPKMHQDVKVAFPQSYINSQPIPSPGPMTPGLPGTMTSQRGINLADIPLTPSGVRPVPGAVLPDRAAGSYRTGDHFYEAPGRANKSERQRRRHEKEDVVARKFGGFWRGRGFIPEEGCFGRSGREGRKRRRMCLGILGGVIAAIILIVVLVVVLTQRAMSPAVVKAPPGAHASPDASPNVHEAEYWLNLTGFPPMPTGVLTVAGPKNPVAVSGCFTDDTPSTAWSCALPKEDHDSGAPYEPNQPEFIFQIQFDNNTQELWKLADEAKPSKTERRDFVTDRGFKPDPAPPTLDEMSFLGNTTDDIKAERKEGEPTPFFISLLESIDKTVGPDVLTRRQGNAIGGASGNGTGNFNLSDVLPPPTLNPDGTGAPARLFPLPVQQPVRLFDRDLPTEHYGFYTYFDKKIYMANNRARDPADEDGGVPIADAKALVTFAQTRFLVKIWTRSDNTTHLLNSGDPAVNVTATPSVQPGSMPYPVTVLEDMHGGDPSKKMDFAYGVLDNMQIDRGNASGVVADIGFKGTLVNGRGQGADTSLGGFDGGTGGCKCEWVNFEKS
ncbi:hypothetical protein HD806DRAFT_536701 [Xylariaceae sp. AK1471]|nr:hypothetical protein HD806DRAFT_536701 [Xylariaceae sp. AK1471]